MKQTPATAQISPLPWSASKDHHIFSSDDTHIVECWSGSPDVSSEAHAAFILLACNNHTRLVGALKDLLESQQDGTCFNEIDWRKSEETARNLLASLEQA